MVSNKLSLLVSACLALIVVSAEATPPPDTSLSRGEFMFAKCLPLSVSNADVCAIVTLSKKPEAKTLKVSAGDNRSEKDQFLEFEVKALDGFGVKPGDVYKCLFNETNVPTGSFAKKYLLIGWKSRASGMLLVDAQDRFQLSRGLVGRTVEGGDSTLRAIAMIPTSADTVLTNSNNAKRAYSNMAKALEGKASDSTIRAVTYIWAQLSDHGDLMNRIDGLFPAQWTAELLYRQISNLDQDSPLKKLRFGGLLAAWNRKANALTFIKKLSPLLLDLCKVSSRDQKSEDGSFLYALNLVRGVDGDSLFEVLRNAPELREMLFSPNLPKPSLENQKWYFGMLNSTSAEERGWVLDQFASWYAQWDKRTNAKWSDETQGIVVPREQELTEYWRNKILGPDKP